MSTIVSTRILRLQAISPRYSPVNLGQGLTATWADLANRPANLAALAGDESIKNGDIAVDANGRITGIGIGALTKVANNQITIDASGNLVGIGPGNSTTVANGAIAIDGSGRIVGIGSGALTTIANSVINITAGQLQGIGAGAGTTVANSSISIDANGRISGVGTGNLTSVSNTVLSLSTGGQLTYSSPTGPVNLGSTTLSGLGAGAFAALNQLSAENIDTFVAANAIGSTYIGSVAANKITAGTLISGVVYAGSINASQVTAGTMVAERISGGTLKGTSLAIASDNSGWLFNAGLYGTFVGYRRLNGYNIYASAFDSPGDPAITGYGIGNVGVYGYSTTNTFVNSHGLRGGRATGESGIVGCSNGYDFYAEGTGTNYGPFTGAHDALLLPGSEIEPGDIVVDCECLVRRGLSNTLCRVERSSSAGQAGVVGVLVKVAGRLADCYVPAVFAAPVITVDDYGNAIADLDDDYELLRNDYDLAMINALGEGQINVCGLGGNLQPGDLIIASSIPGKGMRQPDDVIRSSTVAKCREAVSFSDPNEVKMVACIYLCG